ncbi:hypothetical protein PM082_020019 [Marasmius tenuissimus]|nr:hypothetical protein PM082_020019 [Marasmius tenuissimus]
MGVTTQWIQGMDDNLYLCAAVIGFYSLPVSHTGKHMATVFYNILNQLGLIQQIEWVTLDNASNNNTMMEWLQVMLNHDCIPFDALKRHVQ